MSKAFTIDEILEFYKDPTTLDLSKFKNRLKVDKKALKQYDELRAKLLEEGLKTSADVVEAFVAQLLRGASEYDATLEAVEDAKKRAEEAKEKDAEAYELAGKVVAGTEQVPQDDQEKADKVNAGVQIIRSMHGFVEQLQNAIFNFQHAEQTLKNLAKYLK